MEKILIKKLSFFQKLKIQYLTFKFMEKISYNNIIDVDSGYKCLNEFKKPTCVIVKHTNPCGVALKIQLIWHFKEHLDVT